MSLQPYIDIHTHTPMAESNDGILEMVNKYDGFDQSPLPLYCSFGLHPWYISDANQQLKQLSQSAIRPEVRAIGECGLDKLCGIDWQVQIDLFARQIDLANRLGKPLIIHCVRAYTEVLYMLRKATVPVLFHGFNKRGNLATEITDKGYHLSFGAGLLLDAAQEKEVLPWVPADHFFLETDNSRANIRDIYKAAAAIRKTEEDVIILQLQQNYKKVFGT